MKKNDPPPGYKVPTGPMYGKGPTPLIWCGECHVHDCPDSWGRCWWCGRQLDFIKDDSNDKQE